MITTHVDTDLGMLLPFRAEIDLASYLEILIAGFQTSMAFSDSQICTEGRGSAVIYSADRNDSGHPYLFEGCDTAYQILYFTPLRRNLLGDEVYRQALFVIEHSGHISMGLSSFQNRHHGQDCFLPRGPIYQRKTRRDRRVLIDGLIFLRRRDGRSTIARLHDFSPSGASFYTDEAFVFGETLLAEFEIPDCGVCETVVTVVRQDILSLGNPYRFIVGVKMQLTSAQRKKAEQLYLCKKAESMKRIVDSARSSIG